MSRRVAVPLAAGFAAAAVVFAVVLLATGGGDRPAPAPAATASASAAPGRAVFARMGCGSCHTLTAAGSTGVIGPSLDVALAHHTPASLRAKISAPGAGGVMPDDFAERMSASDLTALVDFLTAAHAR